MTCTALFAPLLLALSAAACAPADDVVASADEAAMLPTLREEEKLAHDVYVALDAQAPQFANIAASEQTDLHDLAGVQESADHADVSTTLSNLARGSRNHLRAFWSQLAAAGGTYTPRHLDEATFRAIVNSPQETGRPF
jgi:hypothetical protein